MIRKFGVTAILPALATPVAATAQTVLGQPTPWQVGLQAAGAERMRDIITLHNFVLYIITAISLFVGGLLVSIIARHNARANPVPTAMTLEWTLSSPPPFHTYNDLPRVPSLKAENR